MKKVAVAISLALLLLPATGFAKDWGHRHGRGHGHGRHHGNTVIIRDRHHHDGAMIAVGVLGGIATGVLLDRILTAPPAPQPVSYPPPPPPRPRDPFDEGYREGYGQGVERGRYERYEEGKRRGYEEGYEDARAGKAY